MRVGWFSRGEFLALLWRVGGIALSSVSSLLALKVFMALGAANAASLIALIGWLAFLPLMQWGYGRPVYGLLRARLSRGEGASGLVLLWRRRFIVFAITALVIFSLAAPLIGHRQGWTGSVQELAMFAAGLVAVSSGTFFRDIAYAASEEDCYERAEFARKLLLAVAYLLLMAGLPLNAVGTILLLFGCLTHRGLLVRIGHIGGSAVNTNPPSTVADTPGLNAAARRYFAYSVNEVLLYNLPLVYFSVVGGVSALVAFGVWSRLFQLLVLPMRVLVDARVNRQTSAHFRGDSSALSLELGKSLLLGTGGLLATLIPCLLLLPLILEWLGAPPLHQDPWFIAALAIWSAANLVQHVYGAFVLSYGNGFGFALRTSLACVLTVSAVFVPLALSGQTVGVLLASCGPVYAFFAWRYRQHALACAAGTTPSPNNGSTS